ncbi:MAG: DEAD/DEAH box helicase [Erythrobacter sp.]|nr:DEAD/DEAH box helicase [Erythrobacter sp.]
MPFPQSPAPLAQALSSRGYDTPTSVQEAVLQSEARGRDLVVSAQTGSGKTVAFGLAFADQVLGEDGDLFARGAPSALVIAPTRELALQVSKELGWLYEKTGARIASCVGGMNPQAERRALKAGATIVVGTPGRLRDHIERGALDLSSLAVVVLDEADEMLDMGFREELEYILDATPQGRRVLMFSATMPRPIEAMARRYQQDALRIATGGQDRGHGDIAYQAVAVPPAAIETAVVNLLRFHEAETAILFCATRERVRQLHTVLQDRGFAAVALSGEHSQSERNQALQALRDGRARVCVATDVAARGIDLPTLTLVIHVDLPRDAETLQHRSGRTGRAGRKGTAVMVVPFNRRRRTEGMLRHAGIETLWIDVPDRKAVLAQDRTRLLETLLQPIDDASVEDADRELADTLLNERSPRDIAVLLAQAYRAKLPEPEEFSAQTVDAHRAAQKEKHRAGFEDTVWFRLDVGRRRNADPRWILPILCKRGGITRNEIGAIRIGPNETYFQVPRTVADSFAKTAAQTAGQDEKGGELTIERSAEGPRVQARENGRKKRHQDFHPKPSNRHDARRKRNA